MLRFMCNISYTNSKKRKKKKTKNIGNVENEGQPGNLMNNFRINFS